MNKLNDINNTADDIDVNNDENDIHYTEKANHNIY